MKWKLRGGSGESMKRMKPIRNVGDVTNHETLELIEAFTSRCTDHWIRYKHYLGRACRDKQICKASDLVFKGFKKKYAKKM